MPTYQYQPKASDVAWAQNLIRAAKDGATWGIPRSFVVFKIDKTRKELVQIEGPTSGDDWENEIDANGAVFGAIGYKVVPMRAETPDSELKGDHWAKVTGKNPRQS